MGNTLSHSVEGNLKRVIVAKSRLGRDGEVNSFTKPKSTMNRRTESMRSRRDRQK